MSNEKTIDRLKLHMLVSLARSQRALARIIEKVAEISETSREEERQIADHLQHISLYQRILTRKITGCFPSNRKRSTTPAKPWLNAAWKVTDCTSAVRETEPPQEKLR